MGNHFDKRLDPRLLVEGANTVISLILNYFPSFTQKDEEAPKISKYAYGEDYHFVIKDKLNELLRFIQDEIGEVNGRAFVDSAPVMDKVWAKKSGLGWIGKNSNLIHPKEGSFFFIAELITDLKIEPDGPMKDYCGTCTRCIDACPTEAIVQPYVVDGSKCISYLTIELKDEIIPKEFTGKMDNWMFGCDICQDVCPWNRFSKATQEQRFKPLNSLLDLTISDWENLEDETFQKLFKNSAVKRTKFSGLKRNISFLRNNTKN
jgi:epoxyqueuosine reductase